MTKEQMKELFNAFYETDFLGDELIDEIPEERFREFLLKKLVSDGCFFILREEVLDYTSLTVKDVAREFWDELIKEGPELPCIHYSLFSAMLDILFGKCLDEGMDECKADREADESLCEILNIDMNTFCDILNHELDDRYVSTKGEELILLDRLRLDAKIPEEGKIYKVHVHEHRGRDFYVSAESEEEAVEKVHNRPDDFDSDFISEDVEVLSEVSGKGVRIDIR